MGRLMLAGGIGRAHQAHLALLVFDLKLAQPKVAHQGEQSFYFPQFHRCSKKYDPRRLALRLPTRPHQALAAARCVSIKRLAARSASR